MIQHRPQYQYESVQQFFVLSGIASRPFQFIYQVKLFVDALLYRRNETVGLSKLILLLAFVGHTRISGCEPGGVSSQVGEPQLSRAGDRGASRFNIASR
jgi:hypothetical protein